LFAIRNHVLLKVYPLTNKTHGFHATRMVSKDTHRGIVSKIMLQGKLSKKTKSYEKKHAAYSTRMYFW